MTRTTRSGLQCARHLLGFSSCGSCCCCCSRRWTYSSNAFHKIGAALCTSALLYLQRGFVLTLAVQKLCRYILRNLFVHLDDPNPEAIFRHLAMSLGLAETVDSSRCRRFSRASMRCFRQLLPRHCFILKIRYRSASRGVPSRRIRQRSVRRLKPLLRKVRTRACGTPGEGHRPSLRPDRAC